MAVLRSEQVCLWRSRAYYLGQYYCRLKPEGRGSSSCHALYLPVMLTGWFTALTFITLWSLHLQKAMPSNAILWNIFIVVLLNFPLMILTHLLAKPHHADHTSSYHHGNPHAKCSLCRHWSTGKGHTLSLREKLGISVIMMILLFKSSVKCVRVALPLMLILLSGDVETNPGPYANLGPNDLGKVVRLTHAACVRWYYLGLELGVLATTLDIIERKKGSSNVEDCNTEMLLTWLRMTDPPPTWERLIAALKQDTVRRPDVAEIIEIECARLQDETDSAVENCHNEKALLSSANEAVEKVFGSLLIKEQIRMLEKDFKAISDQTYIKVEEMGMSVGRLKVQLTSLFVEYKDEHEEFFEQMEEQIDRCSTVDAVWRRFGKYWNYLNYTQLQSFIVDSLNDPILTQKMNEYLLKLHFFLRHTRVCDFARHRPKARGISEADFKMFVLRLKLDWENSTLNDVDELAGHVMRKFHIPKFTFNLEEVKLGSVLITWSMPAVIATRMKCSISGNADMPSFCNEHGILSICIDGVECKFTLKQYLKKVYSSFTARKKLAPFTLTRLIFSIRQLSKSAAVKEVDKKYNRESIKEHQVSYTIHRKQPKLVLIEGAPGVGKTTFSEQFCYNWSQKQHLSNHKLVILFQLRNNRVRFAKNLSDLFQHPQLQQAIAEEVERSGGEGVALWLEAWDELEEEMREKSSLFLELMQGRVLPKATIVITSRPWATSTIRRKSPDLHITIESSPSKQLEWVLKESMVKPKEFLDYVNTNFVMKAAMHTPVTANIVRDVFLWNLDNECPPPTTMTELYMAYTCKLISEASGTKGLKIQSLDEAPEELLNLCNLSWRGLGRQKLTFESDSVGRDTLGLMHQVKELYGGEDSMPSYHFIHLTLQEFLSAYHITRLPSETQEQIITQSMTEGHLGVMVKFFFGLSPPTTDFTSSLIAQHISPQLDIEKVHLYHWLYEAGDVMRKLTISKGLRSNEKVTVHSSHVWTPLDYFVLGHFISQFNFTWQLEFSLTSMNDEDMEMLCKGMSNSVSSWSGKIAEANFDTNKITANGVKWLDHLPAQILQQIEHLDMNSNKLDNLITFSSVISKFKALQGLKLQGNPIGKGRAVKFLKSLHKIPLLTLDLRITGIGEEDSVALTELICNSTLETLCIDGDLLPFIMKYPLQHGTLPTLNLSNTPLSYEAIASLASLLQQTTLKVKKLDIGQCHVYSDGAIQLARALNSNHWLIVLDMRWNSIGAEGATAMGKMLEENKTLEELYLGGDPSLRNGMDALNNSLQKNTTLQHLYVSEYHHSSDTRIVTREEINTSGVYAMQSHS